MLLSENTTGDPEGAVIILEAVVQLTDREQMVVHTLAKGSTHKEIACELRITVPTVKAHMKSIMGKTKSSTRTGILAQVLCP